MRHLKRGRKLNRTPSHKRAMLRNMVASLFANGRITTTPAKAKEARPFAEKLITLARSGTLHARRRALSLLQDKAMVRSLFAEIGPRYQNRPGGYTRILHLAKTRVGDSAPQAIFELVEGEMKSRGKAVRADVADTASSVAGAIAEEVKSVEAEVVSSDAIAEESAPAEDAAADETPAEASSDAEAEKPASDEATPDKE